MFSPRVYLPFTWSKQKSEQLPQKDQLLDSHYSYNYYFAPSVPPNVLLMAVEDHAFSMKWWKLFYLNIILSSHSKDFETIQKHCLTFVHPCLPWTITLITAGLTSFENLRNLECVKFVLYRQFEQINPLYPLRQYTIIMCIGTPLDSLRVVTYY